MESTFLFYELIGVGGQVDFLRGAAICPEGGKPILALPSTTRKGESKIVPFLKIGNPIWLCAPGCRTKACLQLLF